jgi:hypothetical protein
MEEYITMEEKTTKPDPQATPPKKKLHELAIPGVLLIGFLGFVIISAIISKCSG